MSAPARWLPVVLLLGISLAATAAEKPDPELDRLRAELAELDADPSLGELARVERLRARQAVERVADTKPRQREHPVLVAGRRLEVARVAAQAELLRQQSEQLDRERDQIMLEAARRDAEQARGEAERLRMLNLTRAEEVERARTETRESMIETEQAQRLAEARAREAALARREAELATAAAAGLRMQLDGLIARREARGEVMTLSGDVFATGQGALRPEARDNLNRLIDFVQRKPAAKVLIEGHTDSTGSAQANQALSLRRAQSVRQALIEEGVDPRRLEAAGLGQGKPIGDNATAEGRARNRRVDVLVLD